MDLEPPADSVGVPNAGSPSAADDSIAGRSPLAKQVVALDPTKRQQHAEDIVLRTVRELTGTPTSELSATTPLMDAGIDSLAATELAQQLRMLTGLPLLPTLVFDEPSPRAIADHLMTQVIGSVEAEHAATGIMAKCRVHEGSAIADRRLACWNGSASGQNFVPTCSSSPIVRWHSSLCLPTWSHFISRCPGDDARRPSMQLSYRRRAF
eukprot:1429264-Prymnesium_polylepis.1